MLGCVQARTAGALFDAQSRTSTAQMHRTWGLGLNVAQASRTMHLRSESSPVALLDWFRLNEGKPQRRILWEPVVPKGKMKRVAFVTQ